MFEMQTPWWEMVVRAAVIYGVLLVFVRLSGRRTVGQFTPFDLLVVMLLSESVSNGLSGEEQSVTGGLISAFTLIALNLATAFATSRSKAVQTAVEGNPSSSARTGRCWMTFSNESACQWLTLKRRCVKLIVNCQTCAGHF